MAKPILYAFSKSSCSWRVRIALAYKAIDHEIRVIRTPDNENRSSEYLKVNPMGMIPALAVDGNVLAESVAMLEYLEEVYPQQPLLPKDPIKRAQVRQLCQLIACGVQPLQNPHVAEKARPGNPEGQNEWLNYYIGKGFAAFETILNQVNSNGKYCVGDSLSMADCCLVPQVWNASERFKIDMTPYPKIMSIYKHLYTLNAVSSCDPTHDL